MPCYGRFFFFLDVIYTPEVLDKQIVRDISLQISTFCCLYMIVFIPPLCLILFIANLIQQSKGCQTDMHMSYVQDECNIR